MEPSDSKPICSPRRVRRIVFAASAIGIVGQTAGAQAPTVPVRRLGPIIATFADTLGGGSTIRPLSDGRVLVNDPRKQRLILLDTALETAAIVADTTSGTAKAYGDGLIGLVPLSGDSSLTMDRLTRALLVLDGAGKVSRIIKIPLNPRSPLDVFAAPVGFDRAGHLVYAPPQTPFLLLLDRGFVGDTLMHGPDSVAVLRQDLATNRIDTLVMLQAPRVRQAITRRVNGGNGRPAINPIQSSDDWTVLNDGTLAVVRVRDYHIDWVGPDGRVTSGPKIPMQWRRLTDSMKVAIMDSIRARDIAMGMGRDDGPLPLVQRRVYVEPSDLPDYWPPFASGFTRGDAEGNLWVRANRATPPDGSVVYDVIDRNGQLIDRVQIPNSQTLVGFGPGVAYLMSRNGSTARLSKARIH